MVTYKLTQETLLNLGEDSNTLYKVTKQLREQIIKTQGIYKSLDLYNDSDDEATLALTRFAYNSFMNQDYIQGAIDYLMDNHMDGFLSRFPGCPLGEPEYFIYTSNESLHISFNDHSLDLIYHSTGQW